MLNCVKKNAMLLFKRKGYSYICFHMKSLVHIYKHNIYGIIGTLVFHVVLFGFLFISEINRTGKVRDNYIEIEFPVEPAEAKELSENVISGQDEKISAVPSSGDIAAANVTNRPSNRGDVTAKDPFFDKDYEREIKEAKELVDDVNKQLSREIVDINSIEMPEVNTEGMKEEEISNKIYTGESNIEYHLGKRYHIRLPIPVYLAKGGGTVTVDISVNREGRVISAKARNAGTVRDEQIYLYAEIAAGRTFFNADQTAPAVQNGTIRYTFIPQ
jgi:hypothetical protein